MTGGGRHGGPRNVRVRASRGDILPVWLLLRAARLAQRLVRDAQVRRQTLL